MDKYHIIIVALGIVIITAFSVYTFTSFTTKPKAGTKVEPVKNVVTTTSNAVVNTDVKNSKNVKISATPKSSSSSSPSSSFLPMAIFENHDKIENFYSIQFPSKSTVLHGNASGSYTAKSPEGIFSVGLVDIPDNSNIQLYMLTQVKPSLKSSSQDFSPVGFKQLTLGGHRAWELVYTWKNNTRNMESIKTFVEGSDNAAAITFSWPKHQFTDQTINSTLIRPVLDSFRWTVK